MLRNPDGEEYPTSTGNKGSLDRQSFILASTSGTCLGVTLPKMRSFIVTTGAMAKLGERFETHCQVITIVAFIQRPSELEKIDVNFAYTAWRA